jgi:hypothetical protein
VSLRLDVGLRRRVAPAPARSGGSAAAGGRGDQPQEAVQALPRGAPVGASPRRAQASAGHAGAHDVATSTQPALEPRLRLRCARGRTPLPRAGDRRRLYARVPGAGVESTPLDRKRGWL